MTFYYTYVLLSKRDNKFYVGWTDNLPNRLAQHNAGNVISTKNRRPLKLIYFEGCLSKEEAIAREKYFKTGFGRRFLNGRLGRARVAGGASWTDPTKTPEELAAEKKEKKAKVEEKEEIATEEITP